MPSPPPWGWEGELCGMYAAVKDHIDHHMKCRGVHDKAIHVLMELVA